MEIWEHERYNSSHISYYNSYRRRGQDRGSLTKRTYETLQDSPKLNNRKGDIVKFGCGYYKIPFSDDWKGWFVKKNDLKRFWQINKDIPVYARDEYALIGNRYRWIKYKYEIFYNYGSILMFLTGNKPCHTRKYCMRSPFVVMSRFPHIRRDGNIYIKMKKPFQVIDKEWLLFGFSISEFLQKLLDVNGDCEYSRDMFIKKIKEVMECNI